MMVDDDLNVLVSGVLGVGADHDGIYRPDQIRLVRSRQRMKTTDDRNSGRLGPLVKVARGDVVVDVVFVGWESGGQLREEVAGSGLAWMSSFVNVVY